MRSTIRQIEHVIIKAKFPLNLFEFFTETLGLPVSWPLKNVGGLVTSGGVFLGNMNVEVLRAGWLFQLMGAIPRKNGIVGIAFEPFGSLENIEKELDEGKIPHSSQKPFELKGRGTRKLLWTSLNLTRILPGSQVFYRKYSENFDEKRIWPVSEFKKRNGGHIGIDSVKEIVIGYRNESVLESWKKLLGYENAGDEYCAELKLGPGIRFIKSNKNAILSIAIKVKSLESARQYLEEKELAGSITDSEIAIKPDKVQGIEIRICEQ